MSLEAQAGVTLRLLLLQPPGVGSFLSLCPETCPTLTQACGVRTEGAGVGPELPALLS